MKLLFVLFICILLLNCARNDYVYWCGDHACVNEKERKAYFKKTMVVEIKEIVEIKEAQKNQKGNISNEKRIKRQMKLEAKKQKQIEKKIKKQARLDEKILLQEEREIKKRESLNTKSETRASKDGVQREDEKLIFERNNKKNKTKLAKKSISPDLNIFDDILKKITNESATKPYPNINSVPE